MAAQAESTEVAIALLQLVALGLPAIALFLGSVERHFERRDLDPAAQRQFRSVQVSLLLNVVAAWIIGGYLLVETDVSLTLKGGVLVLGVAVGFLGGGVWRLN